MVVRWKWNGSSKSRGRSLKADLANRNLKNKRNIGWRRGFWFKPKWCFCLVRVKEMEGGKAKRERAASIRVCVCLPELPEAPDVPDVDQNVILILSADATPLRLKFLRHAPLGILPDHYKQPLTHPSHLFRHYPFRTDSKITGVHLVGQLVRSEKPDVNLAAGIDVETEAQLPHGRHIFRGSRHGHQHWIQPLTIDHVAEAAEWFRPV